MYPAQMIQQLIEEKKVVSSGSEIESSQIQPASLDLRLGSQASKVPGSFVPSCLYKTTTMIAKLGLEEIDLTKGAVLLPGNVYVIKLMEKIDQRTHLAAKASPKSSIGRLGVLVRLLTETSGQFDRIPYNYKGALYAEVTPLSFPIKVTAGQSLLQIRFCDSLVETPVWDRYELWFDLCSKEVTVWQALSDTEAIDLAKRNYYDPADYWLPIPSWVPYGIRLQAGELYLISAGQVSVPNNQLATVQPYDARFGEFRSHYAGFFDPGFKGQAVMEVRPNEVDTLVRHAQTIAVLEYEKLIEPTEKPYSPSIGSSYEGSSLPFSKHFKRDV